MSRKKYDKEFKLKLVKEHLEEGTSYWKLSKTYGIEASIIRRWGDAFDAFGEEGIEPHNCDLYNYSAEFKNKVVEEYLATSTSFKELAYKYKILAPSSVGKWVRMYNNHEELKESRPKRDYFMIKECPTRKTTLEEWIAIVEYCIANLNNYAATAKEYNCSYGQVYSWVRKYTQNGISGLYDKRGRNKLNEELSEIEKLRAENGDWFIKKTRRYREEVTLKRIVNLDVYIAITELREEHPDYPITQFCILGGINKSSFCKWKNHIYSENDLLNEHIAEEIFKLHNEHPDMGYRRIRDTLAHDNKICVNDKRILRICRKKKVQSYIKHRYNCCTKPSTAPAYAAENVLNREFRAEHLNKKWVTDVSEFKYGTGEGEQKKNIYLSTIID